MDRSQAWRLTRLMSKEGSTQARRFGRLVAEKWKAEAKRRKQVRRDMRPKVRDAQRALRAARRSDPERTDSATHRAERKLREIQRRVPSPLWLLTVKTAGTLSVAAYLGLPRVPAVAWLWSAVAVVAAAVGAVAWLAVKAVRTPVADSGELVSTAEEDALMERLDPAYWRAHADDRGLKGTLTGMPELTEAGITAAVRLDGQWSTSKLRAAEDGVRALLGARTALPVQITAGSEGGWAQLTLRTRSAADGADMLWAPGRAWGIDTVTGEAVGIPLGERVLIAGRSGAGKSVATRPLLYAASEGETDRLVLIDLKQIEARTWDHRARVASTPEAVTEVVSELVAEMTERLRQVPKGEETVRISPDCPRITVFVDEGAEVMSSAKEALPGLESLARMGRAPQINLVWATQKPSMSGASAGIPPQIAAQMGVSVCLAVKTPSDARVVMGEDAQAKGWTAEDLPAPGYALLRDGRRKPHPVRVRQTEPKAVVALPDRPIWKRAEEAAEAPVGRPKLTLVKDTDTAAPVESGTVPPAPRPTPAPDGTDGRVLQALSALRPPVRQKDLVEVSGLPKGTVSKAVKRLVESGTLVRHEDGTVSAPAGEATA